MKGLNSQEANPRGYSQSVIELMMTCLVSIQRLCATLSDLAAQQNVLNVMYESEDFLFQI